LAKLGQRYGSPVVGRSSAAAAASTSADSEDDRSTPSGRRSAQEKWKLGAKKALLQVTTSLKKLCQAIITTVIFLFSGVKLKSRNNLESQSTTLAKVGGTETLSLALSTVSNPVGVISQIIYILLTVINHYSCLLTSIVQ
jgi:hypothetical protein